MSTGNFGRPPSVFCATTLTGLPRRREILCLAATAHPSAEWISRQLMEAYGWEQGPCYLIRDRDKVYGEVFIRRLRAMGIRDRLTDAAVAMAEWLL